MSPQDRKDKNRAARREAQFQAASEAAEKARQDHLKRYGGHGAPLFACEFGNSNWPLAFIRRHEPRVAHEHAHATGYTFASDEPAGSRGPTEVAPPEVYKRPKDRQGVFSVPAQAIR